MLKIWCYVQSISQNCIGCCVVHRRNCWRSVPGTLVKRLSSIGYPMVWEYICRLSKSNSCILVATESLVVFLLLLSFYHSSIARVVRCDGAGSIRSATSSGINSYCKVHVASSWSWASTARGGVEEYRYGSSKSNSTRTVPAESLGRFFSI